MHTRVHVSRGPEADLECHPLGAVHLILRQYLSLGWTLPSRLGWPASESQGSSCRFLPRAKLSSMSYYAQLLSLGSGDQTQVLLLT